MRLTYGFLVLAVTGAVCASALPRDSHEPGLLLYPSNYANATARSNLPRSLDRLQETCGVTEETCRGWCCSSLNHRCSDQQPRTISSNRVPILISQQMTKHKAAALHCVYKHPHLHSLELTTSYDLQT